MNKYIEQIYKFFKDWVEKDGLPAVIRDTLIVIVVCYIFINFALNSGVL